MIVKMDGYKIGKDLETCNYKLDAEAIKNGVNPNLSPPLWLLEFNKKWEEALGQALAKALSKSDFVIVRY